MFEGFLDSIIINNSEHYILIEHIEHNQTIAFKLTNINQVWEGVIGIVDKPSSRRAEGDGDYFHRLKTALSIFDLSLREYTIVQLDANSYQFVIKEKLAGMSSLLGKCQLTNSGHGIKQILDQLCRAQRNIFNMKESLENEKAQNEEVIQKLSYELTSYAERKNEFLDDYFLKLCLLLNSKKSQINTLEREIEHLKDEISVLKSNDGQEEVIVKEVKASAKVSKAKGRAKRKASSDEEVEEDEEEKKPKEKAVRGRKPKGVAAPAETRPKIARKEIKSDNLSQFLYSSNVELSQNELADFLTSQEGSSGGSLETTQSASLKSSLGTIDVDHMAITKPASSAVEESKEQKHIAKQAGKTSRVRQMFDSDDDEQTENSNDICDYLN